MLKFNVEDCHPTFNLIEHILPIIATGLFLLNR